MSRKVYVGNHRTGAVLCREIKAENEEDLELAREDAVDEMAKQLGYSDAIWAAYDGRNNTESCDEDFARYMEWYKNHPKHK